MRIGGLVTLQLDGEIIEIDGEWEIDPGYPKRTSVFGGTRIVGMSEEPGEPSFEGSGIDTPTLDMEKIQTFVGKSATIKLNNGKRWLLSSAWYAGDGKIKTKDGKFSLRMVGLSMKEVA